MASMKFTLGMAYAMALLLNICTVSAVKFLGAEIAAATIESENWMSSMSFMPSTSVSSASSSASIGDWAPSATANSFTSLTYSTRPAASGFWTGTDPFSFVPPTYLTSIRSSLTSIDKSSNILSVAASSSSDGGVGTVSNASSVDTTTTTQARVTTTSAASISTSTYTNTITPSPVYTTVSATSTSTSSEETQASASTLKAESSHISATSWVGWALVVLTRYLL